MSKRARWDGPSAVIVAWPPGAVNPEQTWEVEPGHQLPEDAPAALRDELVSRDQWSEVQYTPSGAAKKDDTKDGEK